MGLKCPHFENEASDLILFSKKRKTVKYTGIMKLYTHAVFTFKKMCILLLIAGHFELLSHLLSTYCNMFKHCTIQGEILMYV